MAKKAPRKSAPNPAKPTKPSKPASKPPRKPADKPSAKPAAKRAAKPRLLSGGNPQIAKADGDAPVQTYIAAMPGWKGDVGRQLDALIERTIPGVRKAVRWNTPFYGVPSASEHDQPGWFIAFHCITRYVKVTFFRGTELQPVPPVESKVKYVRYAHIHENEPLDEKQLARWIRQSSKLPGFDCF